MGPGQLPGYDDWLDNYGNPGIEETIEHEGREKVMAKFAAFFTADESDSGDGIGNLSVNVYADNIDKAEEIAREWGKQFLTGHTFDAIQ